MFLIFLVIFLFFQQIERIRQRFETNLPANAIQKFQAIYNELISNDRITDEVGNFEFNIKSIFSIFFNSIQFILFDFFLIADTRGNT